MTDTIIREIKVEREQEPIVLSLEAIGYLWSKPELLLLYIQLKFLANFSSVAYIPQRSISSLLGISHPTYLTRRGLLKKLGLLEVQEFNNNSVSLFLRGVKNFNEGVKNFNTPKNYKELREWLDNMGKSIKPLKEESQKSNLTRSIYNNKSNPNSNNNMTMDMGNGSKAMDVRRFPAKDYNAVLNAYMKCKGVQVRGAEQLIIQKAAKTMFRSDRTVEDIVRFMEWLKKHENDETQAWVRNWTIWTVQKKMPEFIAGKLEANVGTPVEVKPIIDISK